MSMLPQTPFLRLALSADAAASGLMGLAFAAAPAAIGALTALPPGLLRAAGLFLLAYAAVIAWLAMRSAVPRAMLWLLVVGNLVWAVECAALPLLGFVAPNGWGIALLAVQAVAVAVFAELYVIALRRVARAA
ncbi:hypothetical protein [Neoroseomonas lacus]|uniref:Integral membrane protein n=1 Tax=Neoroseomonas lacus TaxID=287609 RepID=A0A917KLF0_9PROT|nr:hypothetical protein [Neoroseomonas lacus]GGJ19574.1 hypothetical protein GCM10011320_28660 [Neoroseomonas lacus]